MGQAHPALGELPGEAGGWGWAELSRNHASTVPVPENVGLVSDFLTLELIP